VPSGSEESTAKGEILSRVLRQDNSGVGNDAALVTEMIEFAELKNVCDAEMMTALDAGLFSFAVCKTV
jgi:hypothetical protein